MSAADTLLQRLERVRQTGPDSWMAASPTRDERTPSVSIKQVDDRVLIHDFGGDDTESILAAVGLTLADLFDRPMSNHKPPVSAYKRRRNGQAFEALQALRVEALVTLIAADRMAAGQRLGWRDTDRLHTAFQRILEACELVGAKYKDAKSPGHPPELKKPSEFTDQITDYMGKVNRGEVPA